MSNTSLKQTHTEIVNAQRQALRDPYQNERADTVRGSVDYGEILDAGTSLGDIANAKRELQATGIQRVPDWVQFRINQIFEKFPVQLKYMGLYYAGGFTSQEVADIRGVERRVVEITVKRGVERLMNNLTPAEYDSIRWLLRDYKHLPSTKFTDYSGYETIYTCQAHKQFSYHRKGAVDV